MTEDRSAYAAAYAGWAAGVRRLPVREGVDEHGMVLV